MGVLSKAKEAAKRLLGRSEPDGTSERASSSAAAAVAAAATARRAALPACLTPLPAPAPLASAAGGKVVRRVARLPTRLFADGSFTRGVAADGLYGLARLTVHEAQLDLFSLRRANDAAETDAGAGACRPGVGNRLRACCRRCAANAWLTSF